VNGTAPASAPPAAPGRRQVQGENRWPAAVAVLAASGLQMTLPPWLAFGPHWLLPALEIGLLGALVASSPGRLERRSAALRAGGTLWAANVLIFALWYWELDRGGPADRCHAVRMYPDFAFPQMQQPGLAPPGWTPAFTDYLYLSFTNAISFSAGDVAPLTRWAKLMMLQSAVSVAAIALVIARAVNILG
jgi:hypothetical protein